MSQPLSRVSDGVLTITFNRPDVFNSFNAEQAHGTLKLLAEAGSNPEIRCVVLTGAGKAFCAGQDLAEALEAGPTAISRFVEGYYNPLVQRIRSLPKPIIAAVNGVAAGAGANLAFACDLVLASENATFIQAFSKIGLVPDTGGSWFLPRLCGFQMASALMMTGDKLSAADALHHGLVYRVFSADSFEHEITKQAQTLAQMPTQALAYTKEMLNHTFANTLHEQLDLEGTMQTRAGQTNDYAEGLNAFLEKRKPQFKGQ